MERSSNSTCLFTVIRFTFILYFLLNTRAGAFAQLSLESIDYKRIHHRKIIDFIEIQKKKGSKFFSDFTPRCFIENDSSMYHKITTTYLIHGKSDIVWNEYLCTHPRQAYSGRIVDFGFLYSKKDDKIIYKEDYFEKMQVGQLFFFNLKLMGGIRNLGVADEVTAIDDSLRIIKFCYLENGKSEGTQEIKFSDTAEGYTEVTHFTWYRSDSDFRDKMLYPFFHIRTINEFHHIIRDRIENNQQKLQIE